jgi:hypothetical protein
LDSRGKVEGPKVAEPPKDAKTVQRDLFHDSSAALDTVRKELRGILELLK